MNDASVASLDTGTKNEREQDANETVEQDGVRMEGISECDGGGGGNVGKGGLVMQEDILNGRLLNASSSGDAALIRELVLPFFLSLSLFLSANTLSPNRNL